MPLEQLTTGVPFSRTAADVRETLGETPYSDNMLMGVKFAVCCLVFLQQKNDELSSLHSMSDTYHE